MKYTIEGFNQLEAFNTTATIIKDGKPTAIYLDIIDLAVLRWFTDFYAHMRKETIDGVEYAWVTYDAIIGDIPLLRVKKHMLMLRFRKLEQLGMLKHVTVRKGGVYAFYTFGPQFERLKVRPSERPQGDMQNVAQPLCNKLHNPYAKNCTTKTNLLNNPSTKDTYPSNPPTGGTAAGSPNHPVPAEPLDQPNLQTTGSGNESDSTKPKASSSMLPSNPSPSESDSTTPLRHQTTTWSLNQTDGTKPLGPATSNPPVPADPPSPIPDVHAAATEAAARAKQFWEPNRFDGLTAASRFMLEAAWPHITAAASGMDPVTWFEARCRAYCEATPPRYVKKFSKWVGSEQYLTEWRPEPSDSGGTPDAGLSRSQRNAEFNKRFILDQLRKEQEQGRQSC